MVVYTKAHVLTQLPMKASPADTVADWFELRRLGDAVAHLSLGVSERLMRSRYLMICMGAAHWRWLRNAFGMLKYL